MSVVTAAAFGYSYFRYLTQGLSLWWIFAAFMAFAVCTALQVLLARGLGRRMLIVLAETAAFTACFFFYTDWQVVLVAGAIGFAVLLWGYFSGRGEMKNQVEIGFFKVTRNALGKFVTAVLLMMIIIYVPQAQGNGLLFSQGSFKTLYNWTAGFLDDFYPSVIFTGSFSDFSKSFARVELANEPAYATLTAAQQSAAIDQAAAQLSGVVAKTTNIAPAANESVSTVAYRYIVSVLEGTRSKFPSQFALVWIIILFAVLRSIGIVFVWVAQLVALIVYELLLASGFMHIEEVSQTKETVAY